MIRRPPRSTLFPYTTLFRSRPFPVDFAKLPAHRIFQHSLGDNRSEEHTSELQSHVNLVCRLLLEKKKKKTTTYTDLASQDPQTHLYTRQVPIFYLYSHGLQY